MAINQILDYLDESGKGKQEDVIYLKDLLDRMKEDIDKVEEIKEAELADTVANRLKELGIKLFEESKKLP